MTVMLLRVTSPVFSIDISYCSISPLPNFPSPLSVTDTALSTLIDGLEVIDTTVGSSAAPVDGSSEVSLTLSLPEGLEAVTLAILITLPLSTAG